MRVGGPGRRSVRDHIGIGLHAFRRPADDVEAAARVDATNQRMQIGVVVVLVDTHAPLWRVEFESRQHALQQGGIVGTDATDRVRKEMHLEPGGFPAHVGRLILAEARLSVLDGEYEVVDRFKGSALVGQDYEPLFPYSIPPEGRAQYVVDADFVSTEEGTGVVHTSALYGVDDLRLCQEKGIAGATVVRCVEGYGSSRHLHTSRLLELSENLPVRIEIVDLAERIEPLLTALGGMIGEGLVTVSNVHIMKYLADPNPPK